jgi:hypothetical protein
MAAYADLSFYKATYLGTAIADANFPRLALRASEKLDELTFGRAAPVVTAATDTALITQIKFATCAVAEEIQKLEASGGAVQSERVGNVSVTYLSALSEDARLLKAAKTYLGNTGLMYRGIDAS